MKTTFSAILATLALASTGALAAPAFLPEPARSDPGYVPNPPHNPTGTFGLIRNPRQYHTLCDVHPNYPNHDHRPRACFNTDVILKHYLSAPNPQRLHGYIDGSGTDFVLYSNSVVTLDETFEIHVMDPKKESDKAKGCADVQIYLLPKWKLWQSFTWCPYRDEAFVF